MSGVFRAVLCALLLCASLLVTAPASAGAKPTWKVVASGLDNPRGLAVARGAVYVAEAGTGGGDVCQEHPEFGEICLGFTGAVTKVTSSGQQRVVTGLPSIAEEGGFAASGLHDLRARRGGGFKLLIGGGFTPAFRAGFGAAGRTLGTLSAVGVGGTPRVQADLTTFEARRDPDGQGVDSNPYGIAKAPAGKLVADAGGNNLLLVRGGRIRNVTTFPNRTVANPFGEGTIDMQSVPTTVAVGPDGAYYVGELTGFPFPRGGARVWRVTPGGRKRVWARGFTNIIDIAFARDGSLYVLEFTKEGLLAADPSDPSSFAGALYRVSRDGRRKWLVSDEGLTTPGGVAVGPRGQVWVSNYSVFPDAGQVVKLVR